MPSTVKDIVKTIRKELSALYSSHEAFQMAWLIFEHLYGWSKTELLLNDNTKLTDSDYLFVQKALERLKKREPIQYILGKTEFYGLPIRVNPSVLIPRPETEELVEWTIQSAWESGSMAPAILDIGTGSGCIAIALAKALPNASVFAWDVSEETLKTASDNAQINGVKVNFEQKNILSPALLNIEHKWDIIVSNPPYVRESEKKLIQPHVLDYEPHLALFVEDSDPLIFYRAITLFAQKKLTQQGTLFFEINSAFGEEVKNLLTEYGFDKIELRHDLSGKCRMVKARKPLV